MTTYTDPPPAAGGFPLVCIVMLILLRFFMAASCLRVLAGKPPVGRGYVRSVVAASRVFFELSAQHFTATKNRCPEAWFPSGIVTSGAGGRSRSAPEGALW